MRRLNLDSSMRGRLSLGLEQLDGGSSLDFRNGETHWDDPIPPEVTSQLLGRRVTCVISRTSLLAWSLMMDVREVEVADVTADGWMEIAVCTGPDFDHTAFMRDIAA